jgi:hypothetical protein
MGLTVIHSLFKPFMWLPRYRQVIRHALLKRRVALPFVILLLLHVLGLPFLIRRQYEDQGVVIAML